MNRWKENLITDPDAITQILKEAKRIAVLGIKPESRATQPAHSVPAYLKVQGYTIIPAPTYYPEVTEILGEPVVRDLKAIEGHVDIVDVFRRSEDVSGHLDDLLELRPSVVWMQLGIRDDEAAEALARAGIKVIQDRCILVEHRRAI